MATHNHRLIFGWIAGGIAAALIATWAFPRAFPLFPQGLEISKAEAENIALGRLRDLGELPPNPYVVSVLEVESVLEHHLQRALQTETTATVIDSRLARGLLAWEVTVFRRDARPREWTYRARIDPRGEVTELRLRIPPEEEGGAIDPETARSEADAFLQEQGLDLTLFEEPQSRTRQLQARTDLFLRYRDREALLGDDHRYGIEVAFAGDRLVGYSLFFDDPDRTAIQSSMQPMQLASQAWVFLGLLLVPIVAVPFVRRYHGGEIGVRRGLQIAAAVLVCGALTVLFSGRAASAGFSIGVLSRQQVTWVYAFQLLVLFFLPAGLMAFLSWSVGESLCRERWGAKLAAFDALFKGDWFNATFARATLRGVSCGLGILAGIWLLAVAVRGSGGWAFTRFLLGPWWESGSWFSIPLVVFGIAYALYTGLFGQLLLVPTGVKWAGPWLGPGLAAVIAALLFFPPIIVYPLSWNLLFWVLVPAAYVVVFLRYGIYTSVLAYMTAFVACGAIPLLTAQDAWIQFQSSLALLVLAAPLIVSARYLLSDKEFVYRYEDIPAHVRKIAERERQKVELETARGIQTSILPELPSELNGVQMSYTYLPATEVGGDFYDVLALEDGRLAVAVGDVAGHGVSSGLVMSMAKSALAVQVTFNPEVEAVFTTLNRMVFQSARRRLLATLCYALIDPQRREMFYASAGHLFPYRITVAGQVEALESISYPLGVREQIEVRVRRAELASDDSLFLFSDGVVEARPEQSDEPFGFDRLEASLARHAGGSVESLRDGVLADLEDFTRNAPRDDDLTVVVLKIP